MLRTNLGRTGLAGLRWILVLVAWIGGSAGTGAAPRVWAQTPLDSPNAAVGAAAPADHWPSPDWETAQPEDVGLNADKLQETRRYAESAGGSGMILRHGKAVLRWGDQRKRYDIKSATKSFGSVALGIAIQDGKIDLHSPARAYHPTLGIPPEGNAETGWLDEITIEQLAAHTAGFEKPGGYVKLLFKPGTRWHYSDSGPNWLAECLTLQYKQDLEELLFARVFTPLGISRSDLRWRNNQYRPHEIEGIPRREFGAGIHANVEALSRIGYLLLREGRWQDEQILSKEFVRESTGRVESIVGLPEWEPKSHGDASSHYGLLWWNNVDGELAGVPRDAYWAWGLYDSLIVVIPSLDIVAVRGGAPGRSWERKGEAGHYDVLQPFLGPIVAAVAQPTSTAALNEPAEEPRDRTVPGFDERYPPSPLIKAIQWAPEDEIIRLARGSDNWPLTWADDGHLYTAYGDGHGFEPRVDKKLSLGLGRVEGDPPKIQGTNIRSPIEELGDGRKGRKACGMLMVDGTLYMMLRNADRQGKQSQLAWSKDHGRTWSEADWRFETLGAPTFINFGQNYSGARDGFVYLVSHDHVSAYDPADRFILMRVPKDRIGERAAYEFFVQRDDRGQPVWTRDIAHRGGVFEREDGCYRSGISYNAGLGRYVWCQTFPSKNPEFVGRQNDARFEGGFGIYDAPEPWGPWTTVYSTKAWDVGPGETSSFPPKWMSEDGKTMWLVFSGDDCFSARKATLSTAESSPRPVALNTRIVGGAEPQPVGAIAEQAWQLTFHDEFEGDQLDRSKWNDHFQGRRINDPELQYYAEDGYEVREGALHLKAEKRSAEGKPYTSGMIGSFEKFSQRYGYFEIRAKCPQGKGLWSAFWLLPEVEDRSKPNWWKQYWPQEIDVLELLGHEPNKAYFSVHWLEGEDKHLFNTQSWVGPDFSDAYHTFAVHWEPGKCVWYVDGVERARAVEGVPDVPMFMLANLAVGGDWPGAPAEETQFPASLDIDYIRVWQKAD